MDEEHGGGEAAQATSPLSRVANAIAWTGGAVATLLVIVILGLVSYAVLQRYVINEPLKWADEASGYLLVAFVMAGAAEALRRNDHIAMDLLSTRAAPQLKRVLKFWSALTVLALAVVLAWSSWSQIKFAYDFGAYTPGEIEVQSFVPMLPMLFGWPALALVALGRLIDTAVRRSRP